MTTHYTVTKYTGASAGLDHVELASAGPLPWDAACAAALEMGAIPGTGEADACAFETMRAGVWVAIDTVP